MIKILSIDGGGIRGIIPAVFLDHLESELGIPVYEMFDLIAGTSTGGILALGCTTTQKYSAKEILELYRSWDKRVFTRSWKHRIRTCDGLLGPKYPAEGLAGALKDFFNDVRLAQVLTEVLITAYGIERRRPTFFKRHKALKSSFDNFLLYDVALATSAAPTYFPPRKLNDQFDLMAMVDGGVGINNPAMCAYVEAQKLYPDEKDFLVVSLGTGEVWQAIKYQKARKWGLAGWAKPILDIVFDCVTDTVDYQLKQLLPNARYFRLQPQITNESEAMDNTEPKNIEELLLLAENFLYKNSSLLQPLLVLLKPKE